MCRPRLPLPVGRASTAALAALLALGGPGCRGGGDLPDLVRRGTLRVIVPQLDDSMLSRRGYAINHEIELAEALARALGLEPVTVPIADRDAMVDALLDGDGDLVLARLTITPERKERLAFSIPLDVTREMLVVPADATSIRRPADLDGVTVAVRGSSSFHATLRALREEIPGLSIALVDESLDTEQILAGVAEGTWQATVADEDLLATVLTWRDDLAAAFPLTPPRRVGWAMRPGSVRLKEAVDRFLQERALVGHLDDVLLGDLEAIRKRQVLRVLTRNSAATTFLYRGEQLGFEYEMAQEFAGEIGVRLELVIPSSSDDLIPWLLEGRGDLIAASMTVTPDRAARVAFTAPYLVTRPVIVARADEDGLIGPDALAGRSVTVIPSSPHHRELVALRERLWIPFRIRPAPASTEPEDLIAGVGEGTYDLTVADHHLLGIELSWRDDVKAAFPLGDELDIAWAVRPGDTALRAAADAFLATHTRGTAFFNVLRSKYFVDAPQVAERRRMRPSVSGSISPYDDILREAGEETGIDWRLLAAVAFQESRFDPTARSWAGALGLMQVMPHTARELGIRGDLADPIQGVRAGALYLKALADRYESDLPLAERLRFALGAYNAGPGHIMDARRIAAQEGLDPDLWFGHVERALPLLGRSAYASRARHGWCRCAEAVDFVRDITERYRYYVEVMP